MIACALCAEPPHATLTTCLSCARALDRDRSDGWRHRVPATVPRRQPGYSWPARSLAIARGRRVRAMLAATAPLPPARPRLDYDDSAAETG